MLARYLPPSAAPIRGVAHCVTDVRSQPKPRRAAACWLTLAAMAELKVAPENAEATEAWNGPLFEVWQDFQAIVVSNARAHGDAALADHHPQPGDRVLDIGCGLGDSTMQLAELVGPDGHAHGVDVAERMIEGARADAERAGAQNVSFEAIDVQATQFADTYD